MNGRDKFPLALVLLFVDVFLLELFRGHGVAILYGADDLAPLGPDQGLEAGSGPGVHHVVPVLGSVGGESLKPLDQKHAGVANLPGPDLSLHPETFLEKAFITLAVRES